MPHTHSVDPSDQPQRTVLAWRRSLLAIAGLSLIVIRLSWSTSGVALLLAVIALAVAGVSLITSHRYLTDVDSVLQYPRSAFSPIVACTGAVVALAVAGVLLSRP